MAWIESHQKLEKSGKLLILAQRLSISKYQAIGHLHALWWWALDNACNGDVTRYKDALVTVCGWSEYQAERYARHDDVKFDAGEFLKILVECGFIDYDKAKYRIHDWNEYSWRYFEMIEKSRINREQSKERLKRWRNAHVTRNNIVLETPMKRDVTHPTITRPKPDLNNIPPTPLLAKDYVKPDREKDLAGFIVYAYKVAKGFYPGDRDWDKANWPRFMKPAQELARLFKHWKPAVDCLEFLSKQFNDKGLDWTLSTIAKHAHEWKLKREKEGTYAPTGSPRISDSYARSRRNEKTERAGGLVTAGKILASVRSVSSFLPEAEDVGRTSRSADD